MILAFSTLGLSTVDRRFYRCLEDAVPTKVQWFQVTAERKLVQRRETHIDWKLSEPRHVRLASRWRSPPSILSPDQLALWIDRWGRVTEDPKDRLESRLQHYANAVDHWLRRLRPAMVLVSSNSVPHTAIPFEMARQRGIPAATFERGYLPESYQIADYGSGPFSNYSRATLESLTRSSDQAALRVAGEAEAALLRYFAGRRDAAAVDAPSDHQRADRGQIRVLFTPVADNTFSVYPIEHPDHDRIMPAFQDSVDIATQLHTNRGLDVVTKPHPTEAGLSRWRDLPREWRISHGDVMSWIDWADVVVCNGSTLEFSALARGKAVVLAGRSVLSGKGIAHEVVDHKQLSAAIEAAAERQQEADRQDRFIRFLGWLRRENLIFPERDEAAESRRKMLAQLQDHGLPNMRSHQRTAG